MKNINEVKLQGVVGNIKVKNVGDNKVASISLATEYNYKRGNDYISETSWHTLSVWSYITDLELETIVKGSKLYVVGRIRNVKYVNKEGKEVSFNEILVNDIQFVEE